MPNWVAKLLRSGVRLIDTILRKRGDLREFSQDPACILRIQLRTAPHQVTLNSTTIKKGETVLALHLWNEHMPQLPQEGAELEWAINLRRRLIKTFKTLARLLRDDGRYAEVKAVFGVSVLFSFSDHIGGARMMQHFGFSVMHYEHPTGTFGEFWENLFSWWLMWTYNEASIHSRKFWRLERTEIWMDTNDFIRRFADNLVKDEKS
jgi:hypothetical protein